MSIVVFSRSRVRGTCWYLGLLAKAVSESLGLNLVSSLGREFHSLCHFSRRFCFVRRRNFSVDFQIGLTFGNCSEFFARESALSFPVMPTWLGTHSTTILFIGRVEISLQIQ